MMSQIPPAMWICVAVGVLLFWGGFWAIFAFLFHRNLDAIPESHRKLGKGSIWALVVFPLAIFWLFLVLPRLSDSWKSYFASLGNDTVGGCGRKVGLWSAWLCLISNGVGVLPYLMPSALVSILSTVISIVGGLVGFVMLLVYCVIINDLRHKAAGTTAATPTEQG